MLFINILPSPFPRSICRCGKWKCETWNVDTACITVLPNLATTADHHVIHKVYYCRSLQILQRDWRRNFGHSVTVFAVVIAHSPIIIMVATIIICFIIMPAEGATFNITRASSRCLCRIRSLIQQNGGDIEKSITWWSSLQKSIEECQQKKGLLFRCSFSSKDISGTGIHKRISLHMSFIIACFRRRWTLGWHWRRLHSHTIFWEQSSQEGCVPRERTAPSSITSTKFSAFYSKN